MPISWKVVRKRISRKQSNLKIKYWDQDDKILIENEEIEIKIVEME